MPGGSKKLCPQNLPQSGLPATQTAQPGESGGETPGSGFDGGSGPDYGRADLSGPVVTIVPASRRPGGHCTRRLLAGRASGPGSRLAVTMGAGCTPGIRQITPGSSDNTASPAVLAELLGTANSRHRHGRNPTDAAADAARAVAGQHRKACSPAAESATTSNWPGAACGAGICGASARLRAADGRAARGDPAGCPHEVLDPRILNIAATAARPTGIRPTIRFAGASGYRLPAGVWPNCS